ISTIAFYFSSRRRHTRFSRDWSSDVCSSDLAGAAAGRGAGAPWSPAPGASPAAPAGRGAPAGRDEALGELPAFRNERRLLAGRFPRRNFLEEREAARFDEIQHAIEPVRAPAGGARHVPSGSQQP